MKLSLFSLNLKGFFDWEARLPRIIDVIQAKNPDIIVLQEVQAIPQGQDGSAVDTINKKLNYAHQGFAKCFNYSGDYGKGVLINKINNKPDDIDEGLGIISKLPFSFSRIELPIQKGVDRRPRIAMDCKFDEFSLINLHYSPKGTNSTYPEWKATPKSDILVGDFNMKPHELAAIQGNYISSYDFQQYISYPSEGNTFDYCLLKNGEFKKLETFGEISDHAGLYYEIEI